MELAQIIDSWDGRSTAELEIVFDRHHKKEAFASTIISYLGDPRSQSGASWLLKRYVEQNGALDSAQVGDVYGSAKALRGWAPRLHLLQSIPFIPIDYNHKEKVEKFLRSCLFDKNKMVRAWAYSGFAELARQFPEYQKETEQLLAVAAQDESAAVRARARNIMKTEKS